MRREKQSKWKPDLIRRNVRRLKEQMKQVKQRADKDVELLWGKVHTWQDRCAHEATDLEVDPAGDSSDSRLLCLDCGMELKRRL